MRRTFTKVVAFLTTVTISFSILFTSVLAQEEVEEVYEDEQMQEEITNEEEASEQEVERSNQLEIELQQREESLREAEILKNQAEERIAKGSVGFFEYVQDNVAISRINNATYAYYTNIGDEQDATSLENMKESIAFIRKCNSLRQQEGVSPLRVSHEMMAISQSNTNAAKYLMRHCRQYYVSENLAFYYKDPFDGWYTQEKRVYEYMKEHPKATPAEVVKALNLYDTDDVQTGHYLNIIDKKVTVTGFAVSKNNKWKIFGQVFFVEEGKSYTVDEYEAMFMDYYNSLYQAIQNYDQALDAYNKTLAAYNDEKVYMITFQADNATLTKKSMYMLDGKEYGQLPVPVKEGYTFLYWQTTQGETIQPNSIFYQKEDIVLTAKFIRETYSIVYDGNGGYNIPANQDKVYNQDIALSSNIPERYLYTFVEWNEEMDGTGRSYHPGQAYTLNSSLYLYAIWQRKEIDSITLNTQQIHLFVGDETQLEVQILPWEMVEHTILEWKSEDENVVSVDDGKIKALKEGETQVYVTSHDGKQAICKVIVQDIPSRLEGYSLSLSGNIGVNFYMRLNEEITEDKNAYMEFISPDGKIQKENVNQAKQDGIYHVFTCEVSAKDMTGDIQAKLINGKGEGIKEYHYSVEEYAKYLIEHAPTYEEHSIEIAKAMMTYGKYTQEYFGYKIDQVPKETNTLEDLDLSWAKYQYYTYGQEPSIEFVGARLLLTSRPSLKLYFLGEGTIRINNEVVSTEKEGNYTIVKISNITNMSEMFNIHSDSFYLQYGIYSYVEQAMHSDNESLIRLGKSLVAYNKSLFYV